MSRYVRPFRRAWKDPAIRREMPYPKPDRRDKHGATPDMTSGQVLAYHAGQHKTRKYTTYNVLFGLTRQKS